MKLHKIKEEKNKCESVKLAAEVSFYRCIKYKKQGLNNI